MRPYKETITLAVKLKTQTAPFMRLWRDEIGPAREVPVAISDGPRYFAKTDPTPQELEAAILKSPVRKNLDTIYRDRMSNPPLSIGSGHIALLLTCGYLDCVLRPDGEPPHVIRGTHRKIKYLKSVTENLDGDKTVTTISEKPVRIIRAVDQTGTFYEFKDFDDEEVIQDAADAGGDDGEPASRGREASAGRGESGDVGDDSDMDGSDDADDD